MSRSPTAGVNSTLRSGSGYFRLMLILFGLFRCTCLDPTLRCSIFIGTLWKVSINLEILFLILSFGFLLLAFRFFMKTLYFWSLNASDPWILICGEICCLNLSIGEKVRLATSWGMGDLFFNLNLSKNSPNAGLAVSIFQILLTFLWFFFILWRLEFAITLFSSWITAGDFIRLYSTIGELGMFSSEIDSFSLNLLISSHMHFWEGPLDSKTTPGMFEARLEFWALLPFLELIDLLVILLFLSKNIVFRDFKWFFLINGFAEILKWT